MNIETLRRTYQPNQIDILLVGESPPKKGRFFYDTCAMTTFTSRPFEKVFDIEFADNKEFLSFFREKNCFLDDLAHEPVDHLETKAREEALEQAVPSLASRLEAYNPRVTCIVLRKIEGYVRSAIAQSGIDTKTYVLPFPGNGHQKKYIAELTGVLMEQFSYRK
jgi:hypothetical protein